MPVYSTRILAVAGLVGLIVAAGSASAAEPERAANPQFLAGPCPQKPQPVPALANARCGVLIVPENRSAGTERRIRLPVAILPATGADPLPDPVVYMEGGPGGAALPTAQLLLDMGLDRRREVIIMGQRGTLYAEPALLCPEIDDFNTGPRIGMGYDDPKTGEALAEAAGKCYRRLAGQGIDLGGFNTTENAADFADLRRALGIERWNVYGVSYGTDLALTYMRDHPEGIRSVTLDWWCRRIRWASA